MAGPFDFLNAGAQALTGTTGSYGGILSEEDRKAAQQQAQMAMAAQLLESGGWSPNRTSFGQAIGRGMSAAGQARQGSVDQSLQAALLRKQLANAEQQSSPFGAVDPSKYTKDSIAKFQQSKNYGDLEPVMKPGDDLGQYQPGNYTEESWANFVKTRDPAVLKRFITPRQEYSPSYQNVTRTMPDGSTQQGTFDTRTGAYNWKGEIVPPGQKARTDAQAKAEGEAEGAKTSKAPAQNSMEYVLKEIESQIDKTDSGGPLGVKGRAAVVTDYDDATRFDNLREQLSTEMRTVYRIPGEGTLSDREQAQYGVQLPDRKNSKRVNKAIIEDLRERTKLRLQPAEDKPVAGGAKRVKVDANGDVVK